MRGYCGFCGWRWFRGWRGFCGGRGGFCLVLVELCLVLVSVVSLLPFARAADRAGGMFEIKLGPGGQQWE